MGIFGAVDVVRGYWHKWVRRPCQAPSSCSAGVEPGLGGSGAGVGVREAEIVIEALCDGDR